MNLSAKIFYLSPCEGVERVTELFKWHFIVFNLSVFCNIINDKIEIRDEIHLHLGADLMDFSPSGCIFHICRMTQLFENIPNVCHFAAVRNGI